MILSFGYSAKFWLGLQDDFGIEEEKFAMGSILKSTNPLNTSVA
jgi:plasmid maintenance system antidote protein VapI